MKKTLVIAGLTGTIGLASVYGAGAVSAIQQPDKPANQMETTQSDQVLKVQKAQVGDHTQNDRIKDEKVGDHTKVKKGEGPSAEFDKLVTQGKITQAQADQLKAKFSEIENFKQSMEGKTEQERNAILRAKIDSFQQWAATQNFPAGVLPTFIVHDGSDGQRHGLKIGFGEAGR
jgi:hypothetical protein